MRDDLYNDLVDVVVRIDSVLVNTPGMLTTPLADWQCWARGFSAGLYYRKTAHHAAVTAWEFALRSEPIPILAVAAASAAWAVVHAMDGDEMEARLAAGSARYAMDARALTREEVARQGTHRERMVK